MDCDLSHPPEKLAEMLAVLLERDAGLVLGSRYLPGGGTDGWSATRLALSRVGCSASRLVLGLPFDDLSGGFKLWRADCLAAIDLDELLSAGYAFQVETTQLAHLVGKRIEEVPFVFSERVAGASKMTLRISLEGIRVTLALRRHHRPGRERGCCGVVAFGSHAPVAQWIERRPPEAEVAGSNPAGRVAVWSMDQVPRVDRARRAGVRRTAVSEGRRPVEVGRVRSGRRRGPMRERATTGAGEAIGLSLLHRVHERATGEHAAAIDASLLHARLPR